MPRDSSHWYRYPGGEPFYQVECSTIPGKMRAPNIRDARKMRAAGTPIVPSVTTVQRAAGTPGSLVRWLRQQTLECALTLDQGEGESLDDFAKRVMVDADRHSDEAATLGTRVHDGIEKLIRAHHDGILYELNDDVRSFVEPAYEWFVKNVAHVIALEETFACRDGYGGKVDLVAEFRNGRKAIIDWKTYGSKDKLRAYPENGEQLAAYAEGLCQILPTWLWPVLINVGISTVRPGEITVIEHQNVESLRRTWQAKLTIWQEYNQFTLREK